MLDGIQLKTDIPISQLQTEITKGKNAVILMFKDDKRSLDLCHGSRGFLIY